MVQMTLTKIRKSLMAEDIENQNKILNEFQDGLLLVLGTLHMTL